jgi:hypothetical protein
MIVGKFEDLYKITDEIFNLKSMVSGFAIETRWKNLKTGVYNNGELTLCSVDSDEINILKNWEWFIGSNAKIILYTAWGDFIYANYDKKEFFFVFSQKAIQENIGDSISGIFDGNLSDKDVIENILFLNKFNTVFNSFGGLKYGQCYILEPYQCLGGDETEFSNYKIGDFKVYIDMLGQTHQQIGTKGVTYDD